MGPGKRKKRQLGSAYFPVTVAVVALSLELILASIRHVLLALGRNDCSPRMSRPNWRKEP